MSSLSIREGGRVRCMSDRPREYTIRADSPFPPVPLFGCLHYYEVHARVRRSIW